MCSADLRFYSQLPLFGSMLISSPLVELTSMRHQKLNYIVVLIALDLLVVPHGWFYHYPIDLLSLFLPMSYQHRLIFKTNKQKQD